MNRDQLPGVLLASAIAGFFMQASMWSGFIPHDPVPTYNVVTVDPVPSPTLTPPDDAEMFVPTPDPDRYGGTNIWEGYVFYTTCAEAPHPLFEEDPGYRSGLDRDGDGVACEGAGA